METWQEAVNECYRKGWQPKHIHEYLNEQLGLDIGYYRVYRYIQKLKNGTAVTKKRVAVKNCEPEYYDEKWDGDEFIRFAVMGDTQFGSKYAQITHLHHFYDICEREGIKNVYHTGDITDGIKMRPGHEYELYAISADEMCDDVINNYPKRDGIITHFITGNHDASLYKHVGFDIGRSIAKDRPDMIYLGRDCAVINLTPNCPLELRHPWDGTVYSISHKTQKIIDGMDHESKPKILAVGHYHKEGSFFYKDVHGMLTGCFQSKTPFLRGKGIECVMGGYIVTIKVDKDGFIKRFKPEFIHYKKPIIDDYKNFI